MQIASQRAETATAGDAMVDASKEMEGIAAEKRQLMLQWQSSLIAMRRRDEALQATHKAAREQADLLDSMDAEESNVRRAITAAQDGHARLQDQLDKEDSQLKYIETQMSQLQRQNDGLQASGLRMQPKSGTCGLRPRQRCGHLLPIWELMFCPL